MQSTLELTKTFAALADPTRLSLVAALTRGEATVGELARPFDLSQQAVSKHLKVLESAGLITRGREAQWRPCHLEAAPLQAVSEWLEDYRRFWDRSMDSLAAYLKTMKPNDPGGA